MSKTRNRFVWEDEDVTMTQAPVPETAAARTQRVAEETLAAKYRKEFTDAYVKAHPDAASA